ncbi:MAG: hypothetical protein ACO3UU_06525 [Minisyncoccia bacterium]
MKLKPVASNMTELYLNNGTIVLFSYETPVAAITFKNGCHDKILKTNKKWSNTTTRHINKWFDINNYDNFAARKHFIAFSVNEVDQSVLDNLVNESSEANK